MRTSSCHGSHESFLISFIPDSPRYWLYWDGFLHPDLSALFCKSNDIQEQSRIFQGLPCTEWSLGAARQQLGWQMIILVPGVPHYHRLVRKYNSWALCWQSQEMEICVLQPAPCYALPGRRGTKRCSRDHLFHLNHLLPLHLVSCKLHTRIISCRALLMDDLLIGWSVKHTEFFLTGGFFLTETGLVSEVIFWSF